MGKAEWLKASAKKAYHYYKRNGFAAMASAVLERLQQEAGEKYAYAEPSGETLFRQREEAAGWEDAPFLSVVVPAYETPEPYLRELLDSMKRQTYGNWELILADASGSGRVRDALEAWLADAEYSGGVEFQNAADGMDTCSGSADPRARIHYTHLQENRGIALNTNEAIELAAGEYIGLLDHDDFLTPDALFEMASAIRKNRAEGQPPVFLYSDEDKCDGDGKTFYEPHFKLDFDLDMLLTNNYVCHFTMMEADTLKKLKLRPEYEGAQDFDLVLRASAEVFAGKSERAFVHIPKVLYHWRCHQDSTASNPESKRYAYEAGKNALRDLAEHQGWQVEVSDTRHLGFYEIRWETDVLQQRQDIGAVAGPLPTEKGKFISGIYDRKDMEPIMRYAGLRAGFGGYLHRAELPQTVEAADVRTLRVQPQYEEALQEALEKIRDGADPVRVSLDFCEMIRQDGLRILWQPSRKLL